jgi:hypothetical protein
MFSLRCSPSLKFQRVRPPLISKKPLKPPSRGITSARRTSAAKHVVANVRYRTKADKLEF